MTSLLNLDRYTAPAKPEAELAESKLAESKPAPAAEAALAPESVPGTAEESGEFEIVLGHRQLASTGLVAIVLLAVFSGVSYLIGKSMAPKAAASATVVQAPLLAQGPIAATPVVQVPDVPVAPGQSMSTAPFVGQAVSGKVYLQVGAIEKGLGVIWAEGLRTNGLDAFVAPGPDDKQWRVLVGPLPNPQAYQRAKEILDRLGVNTFGRRYTQ